MMNELTRNDIIHRSQRGQSQREIAKHLHVSRNTIKAVLDKLQEAREGQAVRVVVPRTQKKRSSVLDQYEMQIKELLVRYPEMSVAEIFRRLCDSGYDASYTILRQLVNKIRRSETRSELSGLASPGAVANVFYRKFEIDITLRGWQSINLFVYQLEYSRRLYLHFSATAGLATTIYEHFRAFEHMSGAAAAAKYENVPVAIEHSDGTEYVFNPTFLHFASHYGFRPQSCCTSNRMSSFDDEAILARLQSEVLQGNRFRSIDHANDELLMWVSRVADALPVRGSRPIDLHREESAHLVPLPSNPWRG